MPFQLCWQASVGTVFLATVLRHYPGKLGLSHSVISRYQQILYYYYYYYYYNFTIRYINNSLSTHKNMARWGLSQSCDCSFCLNPASLLHVVAGCQQYLDRFTWRHDSILNFIAKSLQPVINVHSSLYADVNGFLNPSIITGENYDPDLLFLIQSKCVYVLELTVGFKSNLNNKLNAVCKKEK